MGFGYPCPTRVWFVRQHSACRIADANPDRPRLEFRMTNHDNPPRHPRIRMRRMRRDEFSRRMMRETILTAGDFIYPDFL